MVRKIRRLVLVILLCGCGPLPAFGQTPVGTSLTFQGQLSENGRPANAEYDFQFRLYNAASGGTPISQIISAGDVVVANGVFSLELDFVPMPNEALFDGNNRWIEVSVRPGNGGGSYTPLSPRQKLTAAPYAAYALGGPGGGDGFWAANGNNIYNTNNGAIGIRTSQPEAILDVNGEGSSNVALRLHHPGASTGAMYFGGPASVPGITGIANNGNRRDVRFSDQGLFLLVNHSPDRPAITQGMFIGETGLVGVGTSEPQALVDVEGEGSSLLGLRLHHPGGSTGEIQFGGPTGYPGITALTNNGNRRDIRFTDLGMFLLTSNSPSRPGATTGIFISESGQVGIGTYEPAETLHVKGTVFGEASGTHAVYGRSASGTGIRGVSESASGYGGVFGDLGTPGKGILVVGESHFASPVAVGTTSIPNGINLHVEGAALVDTLTVDGTARVDVLEIVGADLAEKFPVASPAGATPGTVMEIDPARPGYLRIASGAYSPGVAGVVSGANDLSVGAVLGNLPGHEDAPAVALSGRVWVNCDASRGPIEPSDLLTTSDTPGHAMKAVDRERAYGATIGKAMSSLKEGRGLVLVLVSLQ